MHFWCLVWWKLRLSLFEAYILFKKKMDLASRTPGSKVSWFSSNSLALSDRVWVVPYSFIIFHLALPSFIFSSNMVTSSSKKPIAKCQTQGFYSTKQCVKSAWLRPLYGSRQTESTKIYDTLKMHLYTFLCLFVLLVIQTRRNKVHKKKNTSALNSCESLTEGKHSYVIHAPCVQGKYNTCEYVIKFTYTL